MKRYLLPLLLTLAATTAAASTPAAPQRHPVPVQVTAMDLVTKVYGVLDPSLTCEQAADEAGRCLSICPEADETGLWLNADEGYVLDYYGMTPEVYAVANFDDNGATSFSYFFLFPYGHDQREWANSQQCAFCSAMLQEIYDSGLIVGVPDTTDCIFEALGSCGDNHITLSLNEKRENEDVGCFIFALNVIPSLYDTTEYILACK